MAAKSTETLMREVIDREAIRTLPLRYCHCVWQKDLDGYVNLFTEDGSFSTDDPNLPRAQGREGLRKMIGGGLDIGRLNRTLAIDRFLNSGLGRHLE